MADKNKFFYPVTEKTIHDYAASIFHPIRRGECVTTVWVPMAGRRRHNKFIIENIELFASELPNFQKYLLVYIEPLDLTEESLSGYLRLMAKSLIEVCKKHEGCQKIPEIETNFKILDDENASYAKLLDFLKSLLDQVIKAGLEVVFFLGEFDELNFANNVFYNNLKSLWTRLVPGFHYIFLIREMVTKSENTTKWKELNEAILQNIVYVPILDETDFEYMIKRLSDEFAVNITSDEAEILRKLCGGHPYLLKVAVRVIKEHRGSNFSKEELENFLLSHYELQSVARGILEVRDEDEKKILRMVVNNGEVKDQANYDLVGFLEKLGLVTHKEGDEYKLFCKLFERAVRGSSSMEEDVVKEKGETLTFDEDTGAILLNKQTVEEKFTRQEYSVLAMFLKNENKLCTRDNVGEVLWGKESYEKYSDWAIDQLISKLRKKLSALGIGNSLKTIKGRGYKFVPSAP